MDYFLGVDGGATSTACAVATDEGVIVGIGHGGPSNHILAPGGRERARAAIEEALRSALAAAGLARVEFRAAHFGMTGINANTEQARVFAGIEAEVVRARNVTIDNDALVARAGALACRPGVVLIAGTGSVALGEDPRGTQVKTGGWGYLFGDDGSAFALGLEGVRAALRGRDGTGPETILTERIPGAMGRTLGEIPPAFYDTRIQRSQIAALAPVVTAAAAGGDAVSQQLVHEAAERLAALATAVIRRLTWPNGTVAVAPAGGVFRAGPIILQPLKRALTAHAPEAVLVPPRFAPTVGALLLALRSSQIPLTPERLALLAATWEMRASNISVPSGAWDAGPGIPGQSWLPP